MNIEQQKTSLNIMLADDDIDDCTFFEKALKEIPIATHLTIVHNGEQVMDFLAANTAHIPDVLFLDLSMPRKTGFECLIEIKEDEKLKNLPVVVFTTSYTRDISLELNLTNTLTKMGAQQYIRKPAGFEQLKSVLHQALIKVVETTGFSTEK
jgi:CheY-like chemotaxis protein